MPRRFDLAVVNAADDPCAKFPPAYCRNKSMSVASCIHLLVAAAGKKCQPIFESIPGTPFQPRMDPTRLAPQPQMRAAKERKEHRDTTSFLCVPCVLSRSILCQENKDLHDCSTDEHGCISTQRRNEIILDCGGRAQRRHRFSTVLWTELPKRRGASLPAAIQNPHPRWRVAS